MTTVDVRCPTCGSRLGQDATWCSLCYCELPDPVLPDGTSEREARCVARPTAGEDLTTEDCSAGPASAISVTSGQGASDRAGLDPGLVDSMLAELAAQTPRDELLHLAGWVDSPARKAVAAVGGIVVLIVLLIAASVLLQLLV